MLDFDSLPYLLDSQLTLRIQLVKGEVLHLGLQWSFDVIPDLLIMGLQRLGVEELLELTWFKLERVPDGLV